MVQTVVPPDIELFLTGYLRAVLGVACDNKQPSGWDGRGELVVVRDDGGAKTGLVTFDRSVGVTVYAGTRQDTERAMTLAQRAFAALTCPTIVAEKGSPIAAVTDDGCNGPYRVNDDHDVSACYLTVEYSVVGDVIEMESVLG